MIPPLPSERLLLDAIGAAQFDSAVVVSPGRGQVGWHLKSLCPGGEVICWFLDSHRAALAKREAEAAGSSVRFVCAADLPELPVQWAVMPILRNGEAELTRELMQQLHSRLDVGGKMMVAVNAPRDTWVAAQMRVLFDKIEASTGPDGCVYSAIKRKPARRERSFVGEFVFRDGESLLTMRTRPGVFSHRSLDAAARHLITHTEASPGDRILDLGCGCGAVGIAAAVRCGGPVLAVDSNARAVECATHNAAAAGLADFGAVLNHDGNWVESDGFDVALLNPPYYADFRIAEHFLGVATRRVRPGGRILVVTKNAAAYHERAWPGLIPSGQRTVKGYELLRFEVGACLPTCIDDDELR